MSADREMSDRVLTLELEMRHMAQAMLSMKASQDDTNEKVTELRDVLLKGQGAAWAGRLLWFVLLALISAGVLKITGAANWAFNR